MISKKTTCLLTSIALAVTLCSSCKNERKDSPTKDVITKMSTKKNSNPVVYFEIPVTDMDRAVKFYSAVFNFDFEKDMIDHNEMALFPFTVTNSGISGALAKGEIYKPTIDGTLIYFKTENIDATLKLALKNGGEMLYPETSNGVFGSVAEFKDSEGNRIALHMVAAQ